MQFICQLKSVEDELKFSFLFQRKTCFQLKDGDNFCTHDFGNKRNFVSSSFLFERASTPNQQQDSNGDEGLSFYQLHAAALFGSNAGSDGV